LRGESEAASRSPMPRLGAAIVLARARLLRVLRRRMLVARRIYTLSRQLSYHPL